MMAVRQIFHMLFLTFLVLNAKEFLMCNGKLEDHKASEDEEKLTNLWAVELDTNDEEVAKKIARSFGYEYGGRIGSLPMHFKFVRREKAPDDLLKGTQEDDESEPVKHEDKRMLEKHPRVKWAEQQKVLIREKQGN